MDILSGRSFVMLHYRHNHPPSKCDRVLYSTSSTRFSALTKSDQDPWGEVDWQDWLAEGTKRHFALTDIFDARHFFCICNGQCDTFDGRCDICDGQCDIFNGQCDTLNGQCDTLNGQDILRPNGEQCEGLQLLPGAEVLHQAGGRPKVFSLF